MIRPFRENLELYRTSEGDWVRCSRCGHTLCSTQENWKLNCKTRFFLPTEAGPFMAPLVGKFLLKQFFCPSCAVLLDSVLLEETNDSRQ